MPIRSAPPCPGCGEPLVRKPGGRCPSCGTDVTRFVVAERERETRIEKIVAIVSTVLVVAVLGVGGGLGLVEGVIMYAAAGALVWYLARGTFWSRADADDASRRPQPPSGSSGS